MTLKLEVGKYYLNRREKVRGPMKARLCELYPFECPQDRFYFTVDGLFVLGRTDPLDLIAECTADGKPIKPVKVKRERKPRHVCAVCNETPVETSHTCCGKCWGNNTEPVPEKKRGRKRWYVVVECESRRQARDVQDSILVTLLATSRVVADLDLKEKP